MFWFCERVEAMLTRAQLEDSLQASEQDLKYASTTLQADLDRFQRQKVADLRLLAIQLAKVHKEWCRVVSWRRRYFTRSKGVWSRVIAVAGS